MIRLLAALVLTVCAVPAGAASLTVKDGRFALKLGDGRTLTSTELVGAELSTADGITFRIDAVEPAAERKTVLLHRFSVKGADGNWQNLCEADAQGRSAGFPVAGRWDGAGHWVHDAKAWYLTCTSGAQGKCVLWGYDPWGRGPHGEDLARFYNACQYTVRANYDGQGEAHTKNGTAIDVADVAGIQRFDSVNDPGFAFEAGWSPRGAVCVTRTRWPDLLTREMLLKDAPRLGGTCDETTARGRGALLLTRVALKPVTKAAP